MDILDIDIVKGFMRMCNDGWLHLRLRHAVGITVGDAQNDGLVAGKENLFG